jgi:hypothetical protein
MTDKQVEKDVARMTRDYWSECTREAAKVHPNWKITPEGHLQWLGGRTGPRTPRTLLNWFLANCPKECERVAKRIKAAYLLENLRLPDSWPVH